MNKTAIQNLAKISHKPATQDNQLELPGSAEKAKRAAYVKTFDFDPQGLKKIDDLFIETGWSRKEVADNLGVNPSAISGWRSGKPVNTVYTKLAQLLIEKHKAAHAPKPILQPKQHTAVITLGNEHQADFKAAVESVGGQYTLLTYPA